MITRFDHLVIGASSLAQGAEFVRDTLGVEIPFGGVHQKMGTHNLLMHLSDSTFLEVIAVNPDIPAPTRPRWFGLDDPEIRHTLQRSPALLTWVANTTDIHACLEAAPVEMGHPEIIRRGQLSWLFGLPEDGKLFAGGLLPCLIEWHGQTHPAAKMADHGCRLKELTLYHHDPDRLASILSAIKLLDRVNVSSLAGHKSPFLEACLETPAGTRTLRSPASPGISQPV